MSNDNNYLDFLRKKAKFVFKFDLKMSAFQHIQAAAENSETFKTYG